MPPSTIKHADALWAGRRPRGRGGRRRRGRRFAAMRKASQRKRHRDQAAEGALEEALDDERALHVGARGADEAHDVELVLARVHGEADDVRDGEDAGQDEDGAEQARPRRAPGGPRWRGAGSRAGRTAPPRRRARSGTRRHERAAPRVGALLVSRAQASPRARPETGWSRDRRAAPARSLEERARKRCEGLRRELTTSTPSTAAMQAFRRRARAVAAGYVEAVGRGRR
jgi:hypothetical protein